MPDGRLEIVGDEFLTSIDHYDEFHVNLIFDRPIYRPMCTHMGYNVVEPFRWRFFPCFLSSLEEPALEKINGHLISYPIQFKLIM